MRTPPSACALGLFMCRLAAYELDIYDAVKQAHADLDAPQRWWDAEVGRLR